MMTEPTVSEPSAGPASGNCGEPVDIHGNPIPGAGSCLSQGDGDARYILKSGGITNGAIRYGAGVQASDPNDLITLSDLSRVPSGPEGPRGPQGIQGPIGPPGSPQYAVIGTDVPVDLPVGAFFLDMDCDPEPQAPQPLRWLSDVDAPTDTPAGLFLGTTGMGQWGPLPLTVGNLLSADTASLEGGIGDWSPFAQQGAAVGTLEQSSGWSLHGTKSARITCKTTEQPSFTISTDIPVKAGGTYTFTASGFKDTVTAQSALTRLSLVYFAEDGNVTASSNAYFRTDGQYDYQGSNWLTGAARAMQTVVAPPGTTYAKLYIYGHDGTPGVYFYLDCFGVWEGAGGDWSMPGSPIPNLGVRARRPNTDDRLVEVWDGAVWVPIHYDSGWRTVTADAAAPWTAASATLRRVGGTVYLNMWASTDTATDATAITVPIGFRPAYDVTYLVAWGSDVHNVVVNADGTVAPVTPVTTLRWALQWPAADAIPAALPGTLAATAP